MSGGPHPRGSSVGLSIPPLPGVGLDGETSFLPDAGHGAQSADWEKFGDLCAKTLLNIFIDPEKALYNPFAATSIKTERLKNL
jgi:hypothetical protein